MRHPKTNVSITSFIAGVPATSAALVVRVAPTLLVAALTAALVFAVCSCSSSPQGKDSEASADSLRARLTPGRSAPAYTYRIVNTYPHARDAFTQGLVLENGVLYEGTGNYGSSTLRKVDVKTGRVLQIRELPPGYFGEGITVYGKRIFQLTWQSHVGFVYDKVSFNLLREFRYPTEGWGITHDESRLIMSDGTSLLHFLDPETLEETGRIQVKDAGSPVSGLNELEYVRGVVYANVWPTERVAMISPQTGLVVGWIELEGLLTRDDLTQPVDVLNGIAYDSKRSRLFVTGKWWPKLFEIEIVRKQDRTGDSRGSQ
ncbi:MAG: glutaminyl-peptide cyclotransferase [Candidatus Eisenbacteria bacterium]|nr:glutaminyl-peptide cyclotransferase [Candidatus Eisenbacteria bacterium]